MKFRQDTLNTLKSALIQLIFSRMGLTSSLASFASRTKEIENKPTVNEIGICTLGIPKWYSSNPVVQTTVHPPNFTLHQYQH